MRRIALSLLCMGLLAGCTPDEPAQPTMTPTSTAPTTPAPSATPTPPPVATPTSSPSPTMAESFPPPPATESPEQAAIRAAWMRYWEVYDKFAADPGLEDVTETQLVTTGEESVVIRQSLQQLRADGLQSLGGWEFRDVEILPPTPDASGVTSAEISYCVDRQSLQLVHSASGEPALAEPLPNLDEVAVLEKGEDGVWRVSQRRNQEASC